MDPQLLISSPAIDFDFDSTTSSPYATAPSSPKMFSANFFYSAPTSPTHSSFFHHLSPINPQSTAPFQNLHTNNDHDEEQDDIDMDFAFDFSGQLERPSISDADELFHGGKIKPLHPPQSSNDTPRSPTLSPKSYNKKYVDHFSETFHRTPTDQTQNPSPRGRERTTTAAAAAAATTTTTTRRKASRSLSPLRVSDILPDDENKQKVSTNQSSPLFGFMWYNKWNLKNLLLFRSTSEGSATTSNDPLKKYAMITKGEQEDVKNSSFRSNDGDGSSVGGSSKRMMMRKVSAHEIHYTANRAVAEEMRRKTFLPYKSGLLGCLGFHHNLHEVSRGR
ncbi:hypothetical protein L6452_28186 [Arctium lappa]|uniref:Uncharacterized protein n=1 Tax=Arctium lappa TaxID=4217 RepID=A0ACB8ZXS7_ARCLA|nr:hypothetical protein L6452_28186 [Arctium lappa]